MDPIQTTSQLSSGDDAIETPIAASTGTLYLVFIQVASRALTFAGNQFLLRYLSPTLLGLAVQLELLSVTILYTSRESLRVALQRQPAVQSSGNVVSRTDEEARISQHTVNLAYLILLVGLCTSTIFGYGYLRQSGDEVLQSTDFSLAFVLYGLATFIELLAEPSFVIIQQHSLYKDRARAETAAAIARCVSACLTAITMHSRQLPATVLPFAVGQLFYAGTLIVAYLAAVIPVANVKKFSLMPRKLHPAPTQQQSHYWLGLFPKALLTLTTTFYAQSVFKLLLTQGDSLILSLIADLKSQGAFALASNYGGLLSRLLFQPIEESSRNTFGQLLARPSSTDAVVDPSISKGDGNTPKTKDQDDDRVLRSTTNKPLSHDVSNLYHNSAEVNSPASGSGAILNHQIDTANNRLPHEEHDTVPYNQSRRRKLDAHISRAITHLTTVLHIYTLFSLPILTLLPYIFPPLISTLIGTRWSSPSTSQLLSAYSYYLPFLAINGILDAFVTSVATPSQLRFQSILMAGITAIYGIIAWFLISPPALLSHAFGGYPGIGPSGLVWANIVNMLMRIVYSVAFVNKWAETHVPNGKVEARKLWANSMPPLGCMVTALTVAVGLHVTINPSNVGKSFVGIKGLDIHDLGALLAGGLMLATSILAFENEFLIAMLSTVVPQRIASKLAPYLPKRKAQ